MSPDRFEDVMDSATEYTRAMQNLQDHLKNGWLSISKARYSVDPTQLSRAALRAADTEGLHAQMNDEDGFFIVDWKKSDRETLIGRASPIPKIKTDFEEALQMALTAINTRQTLMKALS